MAEANLGSATLELRTDSSQFESGLSFAEQAFSRFDTDLLRFAGNVTLLSTASFATIGAAAISAGRAVEVASQTMQRQTGLTGESARGLQETWTNVYSEVETGAAELGSAIAVLSIRTKQTGADLEALARQEADLAEVTGANLGAQIEATTKLYENWNIRGAETLKINEYLRKAWNASGVSVTELATEVARNGVMFRNFGYDVQDATALLAGLSVRGIDVSNMMYGLNIAARRFSEDGATNLGESLQEVFHDIQNAKTSMEATAIASDIFGTRVGPKLAALIREGGVSLQDFKRDIDNVKGSISELEAATETLPETLTKIGHELSGTFGPPMQIVLQSLDELVKGYATLAKQQLRLTLDPDAEAARNLADAHVKLYESMKPLPSIFEATGDGTAKLLAPLRDAPAAANNLAAANSNLARSTESLPPIFEAAGDSVHAMLTNFDRAPASLTNTAVKVTEFNSLVKQAFPNDSRLLDLIIKTSVNKEETLKKLDDLETAAREKFTGEPLEVRLKAIADERSFIETQGKIEKDIPAQRTVTVTTQYQQTMGPTGIPIPSWAAGMSTEAVGKAFGGAIDTSSWSTAALERAQKVGVQAQRQFMEGLGGPVEGPVVEPQISMSPAVPFAQGVQDMTDMIAAFAASPFPLMFTATLSDTLERTSSLVKTNLSGAMDILRQGSSATASDVEGMISAVKAYESYWRSTRMPGGLLWGTQDPFGILSGAGPRRTSEGTVNAAGRIVDALNAQLQAIQQGQREQAARDSQQISYAATTARYFGSGMFNAGIANAVEAGTRAAYGSRGAVFK